MEGKVVLITGATSGIGEAAAIELARKKATVIVCGRDEARCQRTIDYIKNETDNQSVDYLLADLTSQEQIRKMADEFKSRYSRLDVLLNNAGSFFMRRELSVDGIEMTFALNHLNYFLITHQLLDLIKESAPARIINVSSGAHRSNPVDLDDLQSEKEYRVFDVYGKSKMANLLFTYELSRRLEGSGVTVNALHPGVVATNLGSNNGFLLGFGWKIFGLLRNLLSPSDGAKTSIYLASSPEVEGITARYFTKSKSVPSSSATYDATLAKKLWQISEQMVGKSANTGDDDS